MEDSPPSEAREPRRKIMEEDDDSASSEKGGAGADTGGSSSRGGGALGGTGLSSDSEEEEAEAENGAKASAADGGGGSKGGSSKSAMQDLFGEDEDDDDEEEEEQRAGAGGGGGAGAGGAAGGGGGRYGAAGGGSSDDEDMFGEGGSITAGNGAASAAGGYGGGAAGTGITGGSDSDEDEEAEAPPTPLEDRKLKIPVLPRPPAGADVMVSRLPNILGVKTEAFDPDTYEEEAEADEFKFTTNIIRWRHKRGNLGRPELGDDGRALRESNTRLVRWSDGSTQLLVGDEAFDVGEHSIDRSALFVQQMTEEGSVLQCQGELTKKISFKPSNVLSKAHRTLTLAVRKRAVKGSRIKKYAETIDPEQVKQERARAEEALHKQARRRNQTYSKYSGDGRGGSGRRPAMDIDYLEQGASYDDTSMRDIRNDARAGRYDNGSSAEDDDDESEDDQERGLDALRAERTRKAAAAAATAAKAARNAAAFGTDSEEEEEEEDEGESGGRGSAGSRGKGKGAGSRAAFEDDEEEEEEEEEEDDEDGRAGKRSRAEASAPARGGKRLHRSITEDSSESE